MKFMYLFDNRIKKYVMYGKRMFHPQKTGRYECISTVKAYLPISMNPRRVQGENRLIRRRPRVLFRGINRDGRIAVFAGRST